MAQKGHSTVRTAYKLAKARDAIRLRINKFTGTADVSLGKKNIQPWMYKRLPAIPPFSEGVVNFYTSKLVALMMINIDLMSRHEKLSIQREINNCKEVLASHRRLKEMEHKMKTYDHQNPIAIPPSDQIN